MSAKYQTFRDVVDDAPEWWPAWTEYPHSVLSVEQARQLSAYAVRLQGALMNLLPNVEEKP